MLAWTRLVDWRCGQRAEAEVVPSGRGHRRLLRERGDLENSTELRTDAGEQLIAGSYDSSSSS